jgi:hypothetical protein
MLNGYKIKKSCSDRDVNSNARNHNVEEKSKRLPLFKEKMLQNLYVQR